MPYCGGSPAAREACSLADYRMAFEAMMLVTPLLRREAGGLFPAAVCGRW